MVDFIRMEGTSTSTTTTLNFLIDLFIFNFLQVTDHRLLENVQAYVHVDREVKNAMVVGGEQNTSVNVRNETVSA